MAHDMPEGVATLRRRAVRRFVQRHGHRPIWAAAAPGRINLIGEHTDYNDGFVLPVAIDRWTVAVAAPTLDHAPTTLHNIDLGEEHSFDIAGPLERSAVEWLNYPLGIAAQFQHAGTTPPNLDIVVTGNVPLGAGLSSSASLTVSLATLWEQAAGVRLGGATKARWCRQAEHEFPGVPCGIMDQMIAVNARAGHAMLLDCRSGRFEYVRLVACGLRLARSASPQAASPRPQAEVTSSLQILIADTRVKHALTTDEYALRRAECERAVEAIRKCGHDVRALRDVDADLLERCASRLEDVSLRRARHVVTENARTLEAAAALRQGNLERFGRLMFESHESLRDDYEVSCAELDALVESARHITPGLPGENAANTEHASFPGQARGYVSSVFGARMTGAGFGGCVIVLCAPNAVESLRRRLTDDFARRFGREPAIFVTPAVGGAAGFGIE